MPTLESLFILTPICFPLFFCNQVNSRTSLSITPTMPVCSARTYAPLQPALSPSLPKPPLTLTVSPPTLPKARVTDALPCLLSHLYPTTVRTTHTQTHSHATHLWPQQSPFLACSLLSGWLGGLGPRFPLFPPAPHLRANENGEITAAVFLGDWGFSGFTLEFCLGEGKGLGFNPILYFTLLSFV